MEVLDTKAINSRQTDFDKVAGTKKPVPQAQQEFPVIDFDGSLINVCFSRTVRGVQISICV
jgi:hypothetical protein